MGKTALVAVDVQDDFIYGALGGRDQQERKVREAVIGPLVKIGLTSADIVICSRDWHPEDHCSFSKVPEYQDGSWPVHCVRGTLGARIASPLLAIQDFIVSKGCDKDVEQYSAFEGVIPLRKTNLKLGPLLKALDVDTVIIGGLVLEVCVLKTATDAQALGSRLYGWKTVVDLRACASLTPEGGRVAVERMKRAGITLEPNVAHVSNQSEEGS